MKRVLRYKMLPVGTCILIKHPEYEYIGKIYNDKESTYYHNHMVVKIIQCDTCDTNYISSGDTYSIIHNEVAWIIESNNDWAEIIARAL